MAEAVRYIAGENYSEVRLGGEALRELGALLKALGEPIETFNELLHVVFEEVVDLKNPFFADHRMRIAMEEVKRTKKIILLN